MSGIARVTVRMSYCLELYFGCPVFEGIVVCGWQWLKLLVRQRVSMATWEMLKFNCMGSEASYFVFPLSLSL